MTLRFRFGVLCRSLTCVTLLLSAAPVVSADDANVRVVQDGDTLSGIAATAGVDLDALVKLNGLDDANALSIGQKLRLPGASPSPAARSAPAVAVAPAASATSSYSVAEGDTLWDIAQRFSTTTAAL